MPRKVQGGITLRKDGRFVVRVHTNGQLKLGYARSQDEAEQLRQKLLNSLSSPAPIEIATPKPPIVGQSHNNFASFADSWIEMAGLKPATVESYRRTLTKHINPILGERELSSITPLDVAQVVARTRTAGLSDRMVQYVYTIVRRVLQVAYEWDVISVNPAARIKKPRNEPKEKSIWDMEETTRFVSSLKLEEKSWDCFFALGLMSGLRLGEILGLDWEDVDLMNSSLRVRRSLIELDGLKFVLQTPKSRSSIRSISLPSQAIEAIKGWQSDVKQRTGFIFRRPDNGEPPSRSTLRSAFMASCRRAEVPYITIHGLRHQNVTLLAQAGVSIKLAQQRLGHSTPQITLSIYTHVMDGADQSAADSLSNIFPGRK